MIQAEFVLYRPSFVRVHRSLLKTADQSKSYKGAGDIMSSDGLRAMEVTADKVNLKSFMCVILVSLI